MGTAAAVGLGLLATPVAASVTMASGPAGAASTASCVAAAKKVVTAAEKPVPLVAPTKPVNMAPLQGKTLWVILATGNQLLNSITTGFEAAAKTAGMQSHTFNGQGQTSTWNAGIQQAVSQGAAGIALMGITEKLVSGAVSSAISANIPIVDIFNASSRDKEYPGVYASVAPTFFVDGKVMANYVLATTGCKVNTTIFYSSLFLIHKEMTASIKQTILKASPTSKVASEPVDLSTVATSLPTQVQNAIQRNPKMNYLIPVFDSVVPYVEQGEGSSSSNIPIISHDGVTANLDQVRSGGLQKADVAFPDNPWMGWLLVDELARALNKMPAHNYTIPGQLVDKTNIGTSNTTLFPNYKNYQTAFLKEWKGR